MVLCCGAVLWAILFGDLHAYTRDVIRELIQNVILVLIFCDLTSCIRMSRKDSFASRFGCVCCVRGKRIYEYGIYLIFINNSNNTSNTHTRRNMFQFNRLRCSSIRSISSNSSSTLVSLVCRHNASSLAPPPRSSITMGVSSLLFRHHSTTATMTMNTSRRTIQQHHQQARHKISAVKKCNFSSTNASTPSWLEGDIGTLGTKIYHSLNLGLAVMVPIYFLTPERYANGYINKTVGFLMATGISVHSFIGLNYVCRDYVPKISSKLLGPARIVTAGFAFIMFVGMSKIALFSPNGIKGIITGLWTPSKTTKSEDVVEA